MMMSDRGFRPNWRVLGKAAAAVLLVSIVVGTAEQLSAQNVDSPLPLQSVVVPDENLRQVLRREPNLVPVRLGELNNLLAGSAQKAARPVQTRIVSAEYHAVFAPDSGSFVDGRLSATMMNSGKSSEFIALEPLNLAIATLQSNREPAVWGTAPDGRLLLQANPGENELTGTWSLRGRTAHSSLSFNLRLLPATISRLHIQVPDAYELRCTAGMVYPPDLESERSRSVWRVELGSQRECTVEVRRRDHVTAAPPQIAYSVNSSFVAGQVGLRLAFDVTLDVRRAPLSEFTVTLPLRVDLQTIGYTTRDGVDIALSWTEDADESNRYFLVQLPGELLGPSRRIRLSATTPFPISRMTVLPKLSVRNAQFLSGDLNLKIEKPFELRDARLDGYRQTARLLESAEGEQLTYRRMRSDAELAVDIGYPELAMSARVLGDVEASQHGWFMHSILQWTARSGSTFDVACRIPAEWDITDVQPAMGSTSSKISHWSVKGAESENRRLICEFQDALTADDPKRIQIWAKRSIPTSDEPIEFPVLIPTSCQDADAIVSIASAPSEIPLLNDGSGFIAIERTAAQELAGSEFPWKRDEGDPANRHLYYAARADEAGYLHLHRSQQQFELDARNQLELNPNGLQELFTLDIRPLGEPIDHLVVYLTETGVSPLWQLDSEKSAPQGLTAVELSRHEDWDLPPGGELWEIRLPAATRDPFRVSAVRTIPAATTYRPSIAYGPNVANFSGQLSLQLAEGLSPEITTDKLLPAEGSERGLSEASPSGRVFSWRYDVPTVTLELTLSAEPELSVVPTFSTCVLRSLLTPRSQDYDRHWAEYSLDANAVTGGVSFELPEPAELLNVQANSGSVEMRRNGTRYALILERTAAPTSITISYRVPSSSGRFWSDASIILPDIEATVLRLQWVCGVAPDLKMAPLPSHLRALGLPNELSLFRRFLGPLGRGPNDSMFNPFVAESWQRIGDSTASVNAGTTDRPPFIPAEWDVLHASSTEPPRQWRVRLWNKQPIRNLALAAFFGTLFAACLIRGKRVRFRSGIGIAGLGCAAIAAWVAPHVCAEIAGAVLGGIILAVIAPRRLIDRPARPPRNTPAPASTVSIRLAAKLAMVGSATLLSSAFAQDTGSANSRPAGTPTAPDFSNARDSADSNSATKSHPLRSTVIVPASHQNHRDAAVVYVADETLRWLQSRQTATSKQQEYLLVSAHYHSHPVDGRWQIDAEFEVAVLSEKPFMRIFLPLSNAVLVGETPCHVDGKPGIVVRAEDSTGFVVELPSAEKAASDQRIHESSTLRRHRIALALAPISGSAGLNENFSVGLPTISASRWEQSPSGDGVMPQVVGARGSIRTSGGVTQAELGRIDSVRIVPGIQPSGGTQAELRQELVMFSEVSPGRCDLHVETTYEVISGEVNFLLWDVGRSTVVHRVMDGSGAEIAFEWVADGDELRLLIPLATPQPAGTTFSISADLLKPDRPADGTATIRPSLLPATSATTLVPRIIPARIQVGISAANGFQLRPPTRLPATVQVVSPDDLAVPTFRSDSFRRPQLAYQMTEVSEISLDIVPIETEQKLQYFSQEGRLRKNRLVWSVDAEIETSSAGTFEHRLFVDPRLRIESVSVQEDEAERLFRWSRLESQLIIHLRQRTTAVQNVLIQGSLPLALDEPTKLPYVRFEKSEPIASELRLYRDDVSKFELVGRDTLTPIESTTESPPEGANETLLGRFRLPREVPELSLRPFVEEEPPRGRLLTILHSQPGEGWNWTTFVRLERRGKRMLPCRVELPAEIASGYDLDVENGSAVTVSDVGEGPSTNGMTIMLRPDLQTAESMTAIIRAGSLRADASRWALPGIRLPDSSLEEAYLLIIPDAQWRPAAAEASPVSQPALPDWAFQYSEVQELGDLATLHADLYRQTAAEWVLDRVERARFDSEPKIVHLETRIGVDDAGILRGRTTMLAALPAEFSLVVEWPDGTLLEAMFVDGKAAAVPDTLTETLTIAPEPVANVRRVTLLWKRQEQHIPLIAGRIAIPLPLPRDVSIKQALLEFDPPTQLECGKALGVSPVEELAFLLARYEGLLDYQRRAVELTGKLDAVCWSLTTELHGRLREMLSFSYTGQMTNSTKQLQGRFEERAAEYRALAAAAAVGVAGDVNGTSAEGEMILAEMLPPRNPGWRQAVLGIVQPIPSTKVVSFLVYERRAAVFVLAAVSIGVLVPLLRRVLTPQMGAWLSIHDAVAWALLGILWWTCLSPSFLGMLLLLPAGWYAFRRRRLRSMQSTAIYDA